MENFIDFREGFGVESDPSGAGVEKLWKDCACQRRPYMYSYINTLFFLVGVHT